MYVLVSSAILLGLEMFIPMDSRRSDLRVPATLDRHVIWTVDLDIHPRTSWTSYRPRGIINALCLTRIGVWRISRLS